MSAAASSGGGGGEWGVGGPSRSSRWRGVPDRKHQRSNEHRELSLLAYLSQLQSADLGPVRPLHSLTPYQVQALREPPGLRWWWWWCGGGLVLLLFA